MLLLTCFVISVTCFVTLYKVKGQERPAPTITGERYDIRCRSRIENQIHIGRGAHVYYRFALGGTVICQAGGKGTPPRYLKTPIGRDEPPPMHRAGAHPSGGRPGLNRKKVRVSTMSTTNAAYEHSLLKEILARLRVVRGPDARGEHTCWCPFHPDGQGKPPHQPNLRVSERGYCCHACGEKGSLKHLAERLDVSTGVGAGSPEAAYDYLDEHNNLLYQVCRFPGKQFRQRRPGRSGGWEWNLDGVRRVLYRLPQLLAAPNAMVFIPEGEKDSDRLANEGMVATTNPGGARKWRREYSEALQGRDVAILPDNDEPGHRHAQDVAGSLYGIARSIKVIELPGLPEKGDVFDWLAAGHTVEELKQLTAGAPKWEPQASQVSARVIAEPIWSGMPSWPAPPTEAAFHGLAGDFVRAIEPHTEADPVALLLSFLVAFGNVVGRSAHFVADGAEHYTNLFCVLVGASAKSRKGSSWAQALRPFQAVAEGWVKDRVKQGLSSGEGLIWGVRDPIEQTEPIRDKKLITGYQSVIVDPGVDDRRLLVAEMEFAMTLRVMGRDGNTLSAILRTAWDKGNLSALTKNMPAKATNAHVSIVGHITRDECLRYFDTTEAGNGFGNRFLWACVKRSKLLPEGGRINEVDFAPLTRRLSEAVEFARVTGEMTREEEARAVWYEVYQALSEGRPGLLGSLLARAEAQVMRLACIYALLDLSTKVRRVHLAAAMAVWRYCEDSTRFIFGDALGDPAADEILRVLRGAEAGLTRTDITNHFGRNREAREITRALTRLLEHGLAWCEKEAGTTGRPAERWFAGKPKHEESADGTKDTR